MVEMTSVMLRKFCILLIVLLLQAAGLRAQQVQVEARIAGLEGNEEYMSLLREDAQLQYREDSIVDAMARLRGRLRDNPEEQKNFAQEILRSEHMLFSIRNAKGRLIDRINSIEQEWVFSNLNTAGSRRPASPDEELLVSDAEKVRNLVDNPCFRRALAPEDYVALQRAQRMELPAVDLVNRYFANHATLSDLAAAYAAARTEEEAAGIHDRYFELRRLNGVLADSLSLTWNYIFDNKSYAYGYLLERLGREELLEHQEERLTEAARELSAVRDATESVAVTDYFLRKRVAVDYEIAVAEALDLGAACDSLRGVAAQLSALDCRLPKIDFVERSFVVYDSVAFSSTPKYTARNPIPECRVYARGTIYRILLGTFSTKRAVSTFRGAYPLFYLVNEEGKWCYYAGGFATRSEADEAQARLKKHGFIRPEVVVWIDGVFSNLSREADAGSWQLEIQGSDVLSAAIRDSIREVDATVELSRVGTKFFVVGAFADRVLADRLASELRRIDGSLEIKVVEISE